MKRKLLLLVFVLFITISFSSCLKTIIPHEEDYIFESQIYEYDGEIKSLELEGRIPNGFDVKYTNNDHSEIGNHEVIAEVYNTSTDEILFTKTATLMIYFDEYEFENTTYKYDGYSHSINFVAKLPSFVEVIYENNEHSDLGNYLAKASLKNHKTGTIDGEFTAELVIISNVYLESKTFIVDGNPHSLELVYSGDEVLDIVYVGNNQTEAGKYYVTAKLFDDKGLVYEEFYGIMILDNPTNEEFESFIDEVFVLLFEGDQMSINSFFKDYESFGLTHQEATLASYDPSIIYEESIDEVQHIIDELHKFKNSKLSFEQLDTYEIVDRYLTNIVGVTADMSYMTNSFLGSYLGYQCELPLLLAEYKIRCEQDIIDVISYLESSIPCFESYYQFACDQAEHGYPLTNDTIDGILTQCENFAKLGSNNFLIEIFNEKIDESDFETKLDTKASYKEKIKNLIISDLTNAYQYIIDNLPSLKDKAKTSGSLATFGDEGKKYYKIMLESVLGIKDISISKVLEYAMERYNKMVNEYNEKYNTAFSSFSNTEKKEFISYFTGKNKPFSNIELEDLLSEFRNLSTSIVPTLEEVPNISLKYVPDALKDNFSPAAYFLSPLDETKNESVYINPSYLDDYDYIFTTLAHEGYPGHLYQTVYTKNLNINKIRQIMRCNGYVEGWATYVENKAYNFACNYNYTSKAAQLYIELLSINSRANLIIQAILDIYANYICNNLTEFGQVFNTLLGYYDSTTVNLIYQQLISTPTNTCMYAISGEILLSLHEYVENSLHDSFDEVAFNKVLLDCGSAPLDLVIDNVNEYIKDFYFSVGEIDRFEALDLDLK